MEYSEREKRKLVESLESDDLETKHKKKKGSSTSKAVKHSSHKHDYENILVIQHYQGQEIISRGKQCRICNNIKVKHTFEVVNGMLVSNQEMRAKYSDLREVTTD